MCYGSNCKWEIRGGPDWGECRKPSREKCPDTIILCRNCGEELRDVDNLDYEICAECLEE